ncbi:MAG: hypothetical protein ACYDDF_00390 [Thermoplasmatota archaeon]
MRGRLSVVLGLLLVTVVLIIPAPSEAAAPAWCTQSKCIVGTFPINMHRDFVSLDSNSSLGIYEFSGQSASAMQSTYRSYGGNGAQETSYRHGIETTVGADLQGALSQMFPSPATSSVTSTVLSQASLNASSGPIICTISFTVHLDPTTEGVGGYGATQFAAVFQAGAAINITRSFASPSGYNNTYSLVPPGYAQFTSATGDGAIVQGGSLVVNVAATSSSTLVSSPQIQATLQGNPIVVPPKHADIALTVDLGIQGFSQAVDGLPIGVNVEGQMNSLDVASRFGSALPPNVKLPFVSADGFRALYAANVIHPSELANATTDLSNQVQNQMDTAFGSKPTVNAEFDPASLGASAAAGSPVLFVAHTNATKGLGQAGGFSPHQVTEVAQVLLDSGATISLDVNLTGLHNMNTTYVISLPTTLAFQNVTGATPNSASQISEVIPAWNLPTSPVAEVGFALRNPQATPFAQQVANISVGLDLSMQIDLINAIQTKNANMDMGLNATVLLGVLKVPDQLASRLPHNVHVQYIPADALRMLYQDGILSDANVTTLQNQFESQVENGLHNVTGGPVAVTVNLDRAQFNETVGTPLSGAVPLHIYATAQVTKSLAGKGNGGSNGADFTLAQIPLNLPLQSFQSLPTTYRVTLPGGLSVVSASTNDAVNSVVSFGSVGDRGLLTVTVLNGKSVQTAMTIGVTPGFLIDQFLPYLILIALIIIAIIALPIWGIVHMVRKGNKKRRAAKGDKGAPKP